MALSGCLKALLLIQYTSMLASCFNCPNRHFCHLPEIKYRAFSALSESYLNSTGYIIRTFQEPNALDCKRICVATPGCQSTNHYIGFNSSDMFCDLMRGNRWSNASSLIQKAVSTHFFIKSPCESNPCKNGGTCISLDQENSYKCACAHSNSSATIHGANCETLKVAEATAMIYYNFNQPSPKDVASETVRTMSVSSDTVVLRVPDRKSSVVFLPAQSGNRLTYNGYSTGLCAMYPTACNAAPNSGLSLSFWFKLLKRTQQSFPVLSCASKLFELVKVGSDVSSRFGYVIDMNACQQNAFRVRLREQSTKVEVAWGNAHNKSLHETWSHMLFTYNFADGIVLYFNGVEVKRAQKTNVGGIPSSYVDNFIYIGHQSTPFAEAFMDDLAIWYDWMSAADVAIIYKTGIERNKFKSD